MTQIQTARYEQFLRRLLRIVSGNVMHTLQGDISPVIQMEDPQDAALLFWKGHNLACGHVVASAVPAFNGLIIMHNPPGSGRLVVLEQIHLLGPNIVAMQIQPGTAGGNSGQTQLMDSRNTPLVSLPVTRFTVTSTDVLNGTFLSQPSPNPRTVRLPWVLQPNTLLSLTQNALNTVFEASFVWLERSAEASELTS